jgi:hypothetical protein
MFAADLLLQFANFGREELDRTAAFGAHHVMMAAPVVLVLIARNSVEERDFAGQAALGQKLEGAIDGGKADLRILAFTRRCNCSVERCSRVSRNARRIVSLCAVCFRPTRFR